MRNISFLYTFNTIILEIIWLPKIEFVYLRVQLKIKGYMDTLVYIFAGIGVLATVIALYYFIKDQYAIWEMNTYERLKKKFDW